MAYDNDIDKFMAARAAKVRHEHPSTGVDGEVLQLFILETLQNLASSITQLRNEVRIMSTQTTKLLQDVEDLKSSITTFEAGVTAEIESLKGTPAADDPDVAAAIANIEALTAKIKADTPVAATTPVTDTTEPEEPVKTEPTSDEPTSTTTA